MLRVAGQMHVFRLVDVQTCETGPIEASSLAACARVESHHTCSRGSDEVIVWDTLRSLLC